MFGVHYTNFLIAILRASYAHIRIYAAEISLHTVALDIDQFTTTPSNLTSWYHSSARTEMLIRCLHAAKDYLDIILTLKASEFYRLTAPDYIDLFYALLLLGKFTEGCESPSLDAEQIRQSANLRYYLDSLEEKLHSLLVYTNGQPQRNNIWNMKLLCQETKRWYMRVISGAAGSEHAMINSLNISFTNIVPSIQILCGELVINSLGGLTPGECPSSEAMGDWVAFMANMGAERNVTT